MQTLNDILDDGEDNIRISMVGNSMHKSNLDNSQSRARRK